MFRDKVLVQDAVVAVTLMESSMQVCIFTYYLLYLKHENMGKRSNTEFAFSHPSVGLSLLLY